MSSLSGSSPGNVRGGCPSVALGSLFETTSGPQSAPVSFRLGRSPLFCPVQGHSISIRPRSGLSNVQKHGWYHLQMPPEGTSGATRRVVSLDHPWWALFSLQGRWWERFPSLFPHVSVWPKLCPITYSFWCISCPFPVRGQSVQTILLGADGSSI